MNFLMFLTKILFSLVFNLFNLKVHSSDLKCTVLEQKCNHVSLCLYQNVIHHCFDQWSISSLYKKPFWDHFVVALGLYCWFMVGKKKTRSEVVKAIDVKLSVHIVETKAPETLSVIK